NAPHRGSVLFRHSGAVSAVVAPWLGAPVVVGASVVAGAVGFGAAVVGATTVLGESAGPSTAPAECTTCADRVPAMETAAREPSAKVRAAIAAVPRIASRRSPIQATLHQRRRTGKPEMSVPEQNAPSMP